MPQFHLRLVSQNPDEVPLKQLRAMLEAAGNHVTSQESDPVPPGFPLEPDFVVHGGSDDHGGESLDSAEAAHIARILARCDGNRRQTALLLGIARSTLLAKIRKYRL